ncbi:uncharacterized protein LOC132182730 isoform X2 [Corylus avellana]|uniref:uncharacterized protein LOC132182730 isoform X2 n=1 Tax=Corylus avellana TaxID=13451 RepID=UPI00286CF9D0|nr:uncharacterized protein LOC132182730 isoform X2 [Corylus avellana]
MTAIRHKPVRAVRGPSQGQGRGLIDERESSSSSPNSKFGDTSMQMSPPTELVEGHPSHESSNPIHSMARLDSQGAAPTTSSSTTVRRVRGKTKCKKLSDHVLKNGPIVLNIPNKHRAPIGENAAWFASKIGELVRNMCELHHDEWKKVPTAQKSKLLYHVKSNFELNMGRYEHNKAVENKMGRAYARLRSNLYRDHYKKYFEGVKANDDEAIARAKALGRETLPEGYSPDQWKLICDSFDATSWKKKSERNKKNRSCLETKHTSGTCSFVNVIYKHEQETKVKPNHVDLYKYTHLKKDGTFVNSKCESLFIEMRELTSSEAMEDGSVEERMEEIVTKVLGGRRSGHVRGMGCGLIPTPLSSSQAQSFTQSDNHDECRKRLEETQSELQGTKATLQVSLAKTARLEEVTEKMQATVDFLMSRIGGSGGGA